MKLLNLSSFSVQLCKDFSWLSLVVVCSMYSIMNGGGGGKINTQNRVPS